MASEQDTGASNLEQLVASGVVTERDVERLTPADIAKINRLSQADVDALISVRMKLLDTDDPPAVDFQALYV